ncbi:DUF5312 domain-containing protein [Treponema primitia]|uniref:DUF5312 family protein n=1 Tax=Treponema primitia TaxID=88058 RepID=UPI0039814589
MEFSFFKWFTSLFTGGNDPARAKKRLLKRMAKSLAANKYGKFYRLKTEEASPELAQFFFDVYKITATAQPFLQNAAQSTQLKVAVIYNFLDKRQRDILEQLSPENIELRAQTTPPKELYRQMQGEFDSLASGFDTELIRSIDACYSLIMILAKFVNYDFYFLLKKFDSQLGERSFSKKPLFNPVRGIGVSDEIKDFLELSGGLDPDRNWDDVLRILGECKGVEVLNQKLWNSLLLRIRDVKRSGILEMMIRFIDTDPHWGWEPNVPKADITAAYLETIRIEIFEHLTRITTAKRDALIIECAKAVFGDHEVNRLKNYTERGGEIYKKKNFAGFIYARGLNYLVVFLLDEKPQFQYFYDLILIRGQWVSPVLSMPLSESVRLLLSFPDRINHLDESLSDFGMYGNKLKNSLMRVEKEKSQTRVISTNLETLNGDAKQIINDAIFNLSVLADGFAGILDDYRKNPSALILNWEELDSFSVDPLEDRISGIYSKLGNMLQLLRLFVQTSNESE